MARASALLDVRLAPGETALTRNFSWATSCARLYHYHQHTAFECGIVYVA